MGLNRTPKAQSMGKTWKINLTIIKIINDYSDKTLKNINFRFEKYLQKMYLVGYLETMYVYTVYMLKANNKISFQFNTGKH